MKKEEIEIDLKSLVGEHKLSAVGFKTGEAKEWDNTSKAVMLFTLDKITYKATEDDNDGYRSCLGSLVITDEKPAEKFKPVKVMCRYTDKCEYGDADKLEFIDIKTGEIILEVGTDNVNDYYPSFVANLVTTSFFYKDKMTTNMECVQAEGKDHQGNFEISVSFDIYGKSKSMEADAFVSCIVDRMQADFKKRIEANKDFKIKNIRWNE